MCGEGKKRFGVNRNNYLSKYKKGRPSVTGRENRLKRKRLERKKRRKKGASEESDGCDSRRGRHLIGSYDNHLERGLPGVDLGATKTGARSAKALGGEKKNNVVVYPRCIT